MADAALPRAFGPLLRELRLAAGLTQAALAERAGLSVRAVQHLERSLGQPQRETARRLATAFKLVGERRAQFESAAAPSPRVRAASPSPTTERVNAPSLAPLVLDVASQTAGTPPSLAAELSEDVSGERKRLSVLVAQVGGLTDEADGFDADLADAVLADARRMLMEVVHQYEGTVTSGRGDGLTALFGAPRALEDHAVRACYAALALHAAFARFGARVADERGVSVSLRIGIDSGEVVLRFGANDVGREYAALGPAVRGAARLEQVAADGTTVVARETARLAEGYFETRPLEGMDGIVLAGAQPTMSRFQHAVSARQLTPFVGRDLELTALARPVDRARAGFGQIVGVVGEPGIGKSRLLWEVIRADLVDGWRVMEAGAASYGTATAYRPLIDLLKSYCRIEAGDDVATVGEKLRSCVLALDPALAPDLPALRALLDVPAQDPDWEVLDPPRRRRQTLDALKRLLLRESREHPLVLIVEDLHWIDEETQALLDGLVDGLPAARILLLVSYRPEYSHAWGSRSYYTQVRVDSLAPAGARELLCALLGDGPDLVPIGVRLTEATEGNPLFLEECVRALVEDGALAGEPGAYRLGGPVESVRVPSSVQAVLAARIDRLEPGVKQLLQSAAVIGKDVPYSLLRAIVDVDEETLRDRLGRLQAAELLYGATLFPELEYTFKHALTHEVAYGSLLQERRRALHARVVRAMEQVHAERLVEVVERLAYHALRGNLWEEALRYARQAGVKAAARSAHREAAASFDQALAALRRLPETPERLREAIDIRLEIRSALYPLGEFEQIVTRLREAEQIAEALDDQSRLARVAAYLASCFNTMGSRDLAIESAQRALALGQVSGDLGAHVLANHYLGLAHYALGEYGRATAFARRNVTLLESEASAERFGLHGLPSVFARSILVRSLSELGELAVVVAHGEDAVRIAEEAGHPGSLAVACSCVGLLRLRQGDILGAIDVTERGLELCQTWGLQANYSMLAAEVGYAYALAGRIDDGLALLAQAAQQAESVGALHNHSQAIGWFGEACLLAGRVAEARELAARAVALASARNEQGWLAWALRLGGEITAHVASARADRAERQLRQALALAEALGMRPLQAHCRLGLGRTLGRAGRRDEALWEVDAAATMFGELGTVRWLLDAETERGSLRG